MKNPPSCKAFSLVEMLVVIAVIGTIAAIAVPSIGKINQTAHDAKDRRNAQNIASVYAAGMAAGLNFQGADLRESMANVIVGRTAEEGLFEGSFFGVPKISFKDRKGASGYLTMEGDVLAYVPEGTGEYIDVPTASTQEEWQSVVTGNPNVVAAARGVNLTKNQLSLKESMEIPGNVLRNAGTWFTLKDYNGWSTTKGKLEVLNDRWASRYLDGHKIETNHDTWDTMSKTFDAASSSEMQVISVDFGYADRLSTNRLNLNIIGDQGTTHEIKYDNHHLRKGWQDVVENVVLKAGENFRVEFSSDSPHGGIGTLLRDDIQVRAVDVGAVSLGDISVD